MFSYNCARYVVAFAIYLCTAADAATEAQLQQEPTSPPQHMFCNILQYASHAPVFTTCPKANSFKYDYLSWLDKHNRSIHESPQLPPATATAVATPSTPRRIVVSFGHNGLGRCMPAFHVDTACFLFISIYFILQGI